MKTTIKTISAVVAFVVGSSVQAQIPVSITASVPDTLNQVAIMKQWASQYQQMTGQINQMKSQYESMTGSRGLGQINNNPALRTYLPEQWAGIYDKVKSGNLSGISSVASGIYSSEGFNPNAVGARRRQGEILAANKAMTMRSYDQTQARLNNINALMAQADATQDIKAASDLQNRIAAENAMIQNEQIRLNLAAQLQVAEAKLADAQRAREFDEKFAR
jgi:type IV secretion system protein VirB5